MRLFFKLNLFFNHVIKVSIFFQRKFCNKYVFFIALNEAPRDIYCAAIWLI